MLIGPLDLGEPSYVINGLMAPAVSDVSRVALLPIACEVVINFVDAKQLLDVNVKRSTESFPVVLNRGFGSRFRSRLTPRRFSALALVKNGAGINRPM